MVKSKIQLYDPRRFTANFMPSGELDALLRGDIGKFFIVPVEEMYRHVKHAVPASRTTLHVCLYLTAGTASMKIGSGSYTIQRDELLFVPAGQVFSFGEKDVNTGYLCAFHNDFLAGKSGRSDLFSEFEFLRSWGNPLVRPDGQTALFILQLFKRLAIEYSLNGLSGPDILQPYLTALLCEIKRVYLPMFTNKESPAIHITNRFRELVFSRIKSTHLVSDYADLLHITPNHLNKTVKAVTGKSPGKWIDEAIVLEAKVLLSQSIYSISEVSLEVGFGDQSYFTRLFRKYEGVTPSGFRKALFGQEMIEKSRNTQTSS